jgi:hypothetical protein
MKLPVNSAGLPGNENLIIGSAFLPAPAYYRQEGGASSRLARDFPIAKTILLFNKQKQH